jgi:hypothetical protein
MTEQFNPPDLRDQLVGATDRLNRKLRHRKQVLISTVASTAIAVGIFGSVAAMNSPSAAAAVDVTRSDGIVWVRVLDLHASASRVQKDLRSQGVNIRVVQVPVSPSLIGTPLSVESDGREGPDEISGIRNEDVANPMIGIKGNVTNAVTLSIGRAGTPGEMYIVGADAFAAGELLHCSGLIGKPVAEVQRALHDRKVDAAWLDLDAIDAQRSGKIDKPDSIGGLIVVGGVSTGASSVQLDVRHAPPPAATTAC